MSAMRLLPTILAMVTVGWCAGCGGGGGAGSPSAHVKLSVLLGPTKAARAVSEITQLHILVTAGTSRLYEGTFGYTAGASFDQILNIDAGAGRVFEVDALRADGGVELTGTSDPVTLPPDQVTTVPITLVGPGQSVSVTGTIHDAIGVPSIAFDYVPPYGSADNIRGHVTNVMPSKAKVLCFILVSGSWWVKPTFDHPYTLINADGAFAIDYVTGGNDQDATEIRLYLVDVNTPDTTTLPPDPVTTQVWAMARASRTAGP